MAISDGLWRQAASYVDTFMGVVSWDNADRPFSEVTGNSGGE
jgi:hypothetical protein